MLLFGHFIDPMDEIIRFIDSFVHHSIKIERLFPPYLYDIHSDLTTHLVCFAVIDGL